MTAELRRDLAPVEVEGILGSKGITLDGTGADPGAQLKRFRGWRLSVKACCALRIKLVGTSGVRSGRGLVIQWTS